MNYVFMFKNQTRFRKDQFTDLKMLKISIKQWYKLFKDNNKKIYIVGSYNNNEIKELVDYLTETYLKKYNVRILNVGDIPDNFKKSKSVILNYQMLFSYEYLKEPFMLCANDIFPIKYLDESYLNKEYAIRHKDYTKQKNLNWWEEEYIKTIEYFNKNFGTNFKTMYEGHSIYYITEEFIKFLKENQWFIFNSPRNLVLIHWLKMQDKDIFKPDFCSVTFYRNKWILDKKRLQKTRLVNITLPNHPKSKSFLSKVVGK